MITIFLIDDDPSRHLQHTRLVQALHDSGYTGTLSNDHEQARRNAAGSLSLDSIWNRPKTVGKDSIFLVDFSFEIEFSSQAFGKLVAALKREINALPRDDLSTSILRRLAEAEVVLGHASFEKYYPSVVACAILKAREIPIVIISSAGYAAAEPLAEKWLLPIAASSSPDSWKKWMSAITGLHLHDDAHIRTFLAKYKEPAVAQVDAWTHSWCESHGEAKAKEIFGGHDFDVNNAPYSATKEVKALFMRPDREWKLKVSENVVSSSTLQAALRVLDIAATVECAVFEFPASPGITFLVSLKKLLVDSRDKGAPKSICFFSRPDVATTKDGARLFGVRIEFRTREDNPDGLGAALRLLEKLRNAGEETIGPAGGLAEGIWNLGHCRCKSIRTHGEPWAQMFANGSPYWLAWPSFDTNSVTFHWENQ